MAPIGELDQRRLVAVDLLRGIVMVIMALDHTRDFFSNADVTPTDLTKTWPALFMTRWITHFCAPVFIFLAGSSAYLSAVYGSGKRQLSGFLLTRGLWIGFLGVTFESLIWCFTPDFSEISGAVLWAIGWSMIVLAGLVFLPPPVIAVFGLVMIGSHNLFDGLKPQEAGGFGAVWAILHAGGTVQIGEDRLFHASYPLIPWIGVMAAGYGFGPLLILEEYKRRKTLVVLGSVMILLFIGPRWLNSYGDPEPWMPQDTLVMTALSFLNCHKYPPSLLYLLMTLGPAITLLPWLVQMTGPFGAVFATFGRTPMFFYLLHLPLIVLSALAHAFLTGVSSALFEGFPKAYGYGLPAVYLIWMGITAALYPACRRFDNFKRAGSHPMLKYL